MKKERERAAESRPARIARFTSAYNLREQAPVGSQRRAHSANPCAIKRSDASRSISLENYAKRPLRVALTGDVAHVAQRREGGGGGTEHNRQRAITVPVVSFYPFGSGINLSSLCRKGSFTTRCSRVK